MMRDAGAIRTGALVLIGLWLATAGWFAVRATGAFGGPYGDESADVYYLAAEARLAFDLAAITTSSCALLWLCLRKRQALPMPAGAAAWTILAAAALLLAVVVVSPLLIAVFVNPRRYADIDTSVLITVTAVWVRLAGLGLTALGWVGFGAVYLAARRG